MNLPLNYCLEANLHRFQLLLHILAKVKIMQQSYRANTFANLYLPLQQHLPPLPQLNLLFHINNLPAAVCEKSAFNDNGVGVLAQSLHQVGAMDSVQVRKAVFVKESYTTLGIKHRTYSYPGRFSYHSCVCWHLVRTKSLLHLCTLHGLLDAFAEVELNREVFLTFHPWHLYLLCHESMVSNLYYKAVLTTIIQGSLFFILKGETFL